MQDSKITIENKSQESNSFALLFDDIVDDSAKEIVQWIIEANFADDRPDILNLIIKSRGGELSTAFAIIDIMKSSSIPIRTIGLGEISSAGLMIFIAGTKGQRLLTPNTSIMSHRWAGGNFGKSHELIAAQRDNELTNEKMMNHYMQCTGLTEKKILQHLLPPHDVYLSAQEAMKFGICDQVALIS